MLISSTHCINSGLKLPCVVVLMPSAVSRALSRPYALVSAIVSASTRPELQLDADRRPLVAMKVDLGHEKSRAEGRESRANSMAMCE